MQKNTKFCKAWHITSKQAVSYECGKLFFNNFRKCYVSHGVKNRAQVQYTREKQQSAVRCERIEDALTCMSPLDVIPTENLGFRPHLLAITSENMLKRFDLDTGQILEEAYLGSRYKFKHMSWDSDDYTFVIKSIQNKFNQAGGSNRSDVLLTLVFMGIFPLKFTGMVEITRTVFGSDIRDAMVSQGCLITLHQADVIRVYSTEHILEQGMRFSASLHEELPDSDGGKVGEYPMGLPLNIKLTERPPLLLEVKCTEHNLTVGGFPWHYIALQKDGSFQVSLISSHMKVKNGRLSTDEACLEPDRCLFHPDESGRILYVTGNNVSVFKLDQDNLQLASLFDIIPGSQKKSNPEIMYTSSGRAVRHRSFTEDDVLYSEQILPIVDYENELDLMVVTTPCHDAGSYCGRVSLYDNLTGQHIKDIMIDSWQDGHENTVVLDIDTLVHIVKTPQLSLVHLYHLDRQLDDSQQKLFKPGKCSRRQGSGTLRRN